MLIQALFQSFGQEVGVPSLAKFNPLFVNLHRHAECVSLLDRRQRLLFTQWLFRDFFRTLVILLLVVQLVHRGLSFFWLQVLKLALLSHHELLSIILHHRVVENLLEVLFSGLALLRSHKLISRHLAQVNWFNLALEHLCTELLVILRLQSRLQHAELLRVLFAARAAMMGKQGGLQADGERVQLRLLFGCWERVFGLGEGKHQSLEEIIAHILTTLIFRPLGKSQMVCLLLSFTSPYSLVEFLRQAAAQTWVNVFHGLRT